MDEIVMGPARKKVPTSHIPKKGSKVLSLEVSGGSAG